MSDREAVCLGVAAHWRSRVVWKSERGFLRDARQYLRPLFPGRTSQSAFNRRWRRLGSGSTPHLPVGAGVWLHQAVAHALLTAQEGEVLDGVPVPIAHGARSFHPG